MRKVYIEVPELPTVAKFALLDRPGSIYINLSCTVTKGIVMIVPKENTQAPNA